MSQNTPSQTYLSILENSLIRKQELLTQILQLTKQQGTVLSEKVPEMEAVEQIMNEKEPLIQQIVQLDDGFDALYHRIKEEIEKNRDAYKLEIMKLQSLISKVTELGVSIQNHEMNNKLKMEVFLSEKKKEIKQFQKSNQTVTNYYKNMTGHNQGESYFIDKKK